MELVAASQVAMMTITSIIQWLLLPMVGGDGGRVALVAASQVAMMTITMTTVATV